MKLGYIKLLVIELVIFLSIILNNLIYKSDLTTILFLLAVFVSLYLFSGFEKDKQLYKIDVIQKISIYCIAYYIITYLLGLFTGFLKSSYSLEFFSIIKNIIPYFIILILMELIRYVVITKSKDNKYIIVFITILLSIIDLILNHGIYNFNSFSSAIRLLSIYVLPVITKHLFLSYLSYHYGYKPGIVYRIIMEIPLFLLPIFPAFGDYLNSIIKLVFPLIILFRIDNTFFKRVHSTINRKNSKLINGIILIFLLIIIYFTSGLFKYYTVAIGSGSMTPNINLGDVAIVEKIKKDDLNKLKVGDVLVYKHNDKIIVHRIVVITNKNGRYIFRTKGDNNLESDNYDILGSEVIGKVNFKISYIGYPVVWVNKTFK